MTAMPTGPRRGDWMASAGEAVPDVTAACSCARTACACCRLRSSWGWNRTLGPRSSGRRAAAGLACFQPAVVGVGEGVGAAGDVDQAGAAAAGLVSASAVVVTGPAELPFSQAVQDSCQ